MKKQYTSYKETIEFLTQSALEYPDLIKVESIGDTWEKRPIMMATISFDVATADSKPALLYTGTIHAREWIGIELGNSFIKYIIDNYKFNPKLQHALSRNTLYIIPCLNPDGFEYSRTHFSFWRKNRRNNGDGTFGVDLNRNFAVRFKKQTDTSSNIYGGPAAFSEPETRAVKEFVESHSNITVSLDYHSQGNVFFPAHKFNHEAEIDTTDLNTLCANMAHEIKKVTGRKYGIHRGKPPTNLINGSGREFYYHHGIIAAVVEVGTRNIPDYMDNMTESVNENIPALVLALDCAINYSDAAPNRVDNFTIKEQGSNEVTLEWEWEQQPKDDIYFEIYRNAYHKSPCFDDNLVGVTESLTFTDVQLSSGKYYYYKIRAVDKNTDIKGPFAPEVKIKTDLASEDFSHTVFPNKARIGYVGEFTQEKNSSHFGLNSLFIGVSKSRGVCYGVIEFPLDRLAEDIDIVDAAFSLYPMNRVSAKIEHYGEWGISFLDVDSVADITDYNEIKNATVIHRGQAIESDRVTQGVWSRWGFNGVERSLLKSQIENGKVLIRIDGPKTLPRGHDSQMMQFDIGFGKFGSGLHYRPTLEFTYRNKPRQLELSPTSVNTIVKGGIQGGELIAGYDTNGEKIYGQIAFAMHSLPDPSNTVFTDAYLVLKNKNSLTAKKDIRFSIELVELEDLDFESVKQRESIQYIGYEVSNSELRERNTHYFDFDSYSRIQLEQHHAENKQLYFIIRATSPNRLGKDSAINWNNDPASNDQPRLILEYIERPKQALPAPTDLSVVINNSRTKISWKNPDDEKFVGAFVVRNRFHPPKSPFDGVKIYAGSDNYTYDSFGNPNIAKYYSVFSYDGVPLYSTPSCVYFSVNETIIIEELDTEVDVEAGLEIDEWEAD
jgi:hypothetical protein